MLEISDIMHLCLGVIDVYRKSYKHFGDVTFLIYGYICSCFITLMIVFSYEIESELCVCGLIVSSTWFYLMLFVLYMYPFLLHNGLSCFCGDFLILFLLANLFSWGLIIFCGGCNILSNIISSKICNSSLWH